MLNEDYKEMLQILSEEKVDFFIVGAYALSAHGLPRATGDMDIWVEPSLENSKRVFRALARFGAPLTDIRESDFVSPGTIFQIGVVPRRIDIITAIDGVSFDEAAKDFLIVDLEGLKIPVLSISNLIKNKEATGRPKDLLDAKVLRKHAYGKQPAA